MQTPPAAKIPLDHNKRVQYWIDYFTVKNRDRLIRFLNRGQPYKEVVQNTLRENDLPEELYFLAMIESGFHTHARSSASAVGVWQFTAGTASRYGLKVDAYVDERRDPIRATEAAAKYLRDLYNVFGSWHLAMAAYNAGEMRIVGAIFRARTRNFWELVENKALPRETSDYIPKFIALTVIAQNLKSYDIQIDETVSNYPSLKAIEVPGSLSLSDLARLSNIDFNSISYVNPHLNRNKTPSNTEVYEVWVPIELAEKVQNSSSMFKKYTKADSADPAKIYIVKRGDNIGKIARKFNMTVAHLKRINHLRSNLIRPGTKIKTYSTTYLAKENKRTISSRRYIVKKGDNLNRIAKKFKTTAKKIKTINKLTKNDIFAGQALRVAD